MTHRVKIFGVDGEPFLVTEILVHQDVYAGQLFATGGGGIYHDLSGDGYWDNCIFRNNGVLTNQVSRNRCVVTHH